jgi:hypothetical protein
LKMSQNCFRCWKDLFSVKSFSDSFSKVVVDFSFSSLLGIFFKGF